MNYGEFTKNVAKGMKLSEAETKRLMEGALKTVVTSLDAGESFTVPGLGTFGTKVRDQHRSYSPFYEKFMLLPKKRVVTYYPSSTIKDKLNEKEG